MRGPSLVGKKARACTGLFSCPSDGVTSNFESTFFSKGKSTDFGKVKSTDLPFVGVQLFGVTS